MTFADAALYLGIKQVCAGNCGLSANRHRTGTLFLNVIHFSERRMTKAGLRRFLLLAARRDRLNDRLMLNNMAKLTFYHIWHDNIEAGRLAARLGVRLPAALSRNDRLACLTAARRHGIALSAGWPHIYAWARRSLDV